MLIARSTLLCGLILVLGLSVAAADAHAQCGEPDLNQVVLDDAGIFAISGSDLITVIANPFPDDSLIGHWIVIRPTPSDAPDFEPIVFFDIISNQHFVQNNISVFTASEDLENQPWWVFYEVTTFDIVAPIACISCEFDSDCDDGDGCTTDTCNVDDEVCEFTPIDCGDGDACTIDSCESGSGCANDPIDCDDGDACTSDSCAAGVCSNDPICGLADGCCDPSCDPGGDPDCFVCGEKGDPCASNADCCSNKCKKNGTCR